MEINSAGQNQGKSSVGLEEAFLMWTAVSLFHKRLIFQPNQIKGLL